MSNILATYQEIKKAGIDVERTMYLNQINVPIRLETMERLLKTHFEGQEVLLHYNESSNNAFSFPPIFLNGFIFDRDDTHLLFGSEELCDYDYFVRLDKIDQIHLVTKGIFYVAGMVIRIFISDNQYLDIEQNSGY